MMIELLINQSATDKVGSWLDVSIFESGLFGGKTLSFRPCGYAPV